MEKQKYYISTAIAYTSAKPHIGNTYEIVLGDAIARYKRLKGFDVYFQTGTDEHGEKIELKAKEHVGYNAAWKYHCTYEKEYGQKPENLKPNRILNAEEE